MNILDALEAGRTNNGVPRHRDRELIEQIVNDNLEIPMQLRAKYGPMVEKLDVEDGPHIGGHQGAL